MESDSYQEKNTKDKKKENSKCTDPKKLDQKI